MKMRFCVFTLQFTRYKEKIYAKTVRKFPNVKSYFLSYLFSRPKESQEADHYSSDNVIASLCITRYI